MSQGTPELIEDRERFSRLLAELAAEPLVAVDTEAASFHRYRDRVYLLQLSSRTGTWLVDPLAVAGLPGFGPFLANPATEFVFHDADYDLRLLGAEFGFRAVTLFDTRVAAQFLNEPGIGLAALLEKYLGVRLDKRYQRADWSERPLSPPMLDYAAMDTAHLPELRDLLRQKLVDKGRLDWAAEECALLTAVRWPDPVPPEEAAFGVKGAKALAPRTLAIFRELYVWRTRLAESLDRASFRVVANETLFALALHPPKDRAALLSVKGLGKDIASRRGGEILDAIHRAEALPDSALPRFSRGPRHRPDPAYEARLDKLRVLRNAIATREDLAPGLLAPNWLLEGIARMAPKTEPELMTVEGIRRWQVGVAGAEILSALK